jgi:predicted permease
VGARPPARLRALFHRGRFEDDMNAELAFHLQARADDLERSGMPRAEAVRRARLEFGATGRVKEECREAGGLALWDAACRNVRFAVRLLRASPAFTVTAVLTLALCIGVNTAVFSLVDAVLLRPLPYPEPDRLVQVGTAFRSPEGEGLQESVTGRVWEAVRDHCRALDAAVSGSSFSGAVNFSAGNQVERVRQQRVSAGFFRVFGVPPLIGREFDPAEDRPGGPALAVLSHALWRRAFDADPGAVGRPVMLSGEPHTVVGVMPEGFDPSEPADVWTPLRPSASGEGGGSNYHVVGRLRSGVTMAEARDSLARIGAEVLREVDLPAGASAWLAPVALQRGLTTSLRTPLLVLWGAVGLVLLIGCANIAGLLLARSHQRTTEIATRMALGGGRRAVVGQLLTESLVLGALGGAAGLVAGSLLLDGLKTLVVDAFSVWQAVQLDLRVLAATLAVTAFTALAFGLLPALRASGVDLRSAMTASGGRAVAGPSHQWPRRLLVGAEMALGIVLLVAAGLLVRTFLALDGQPAGFDGRGVVAAEASLLDPRYRTAASVARLYDESLARIRRLPGVEGAAVGLTLPYERALNLGFRRMDGKRPSQEGHIASVCYVTEEYFRVLGIPLRQGRGFGAPDRAVGAASALVNEAFARRFMGGEDPVGLHLDMGRSQRQVVGVVGDVQQVALWGDFGPIGAVPTVYLPVWQFGDRGLGLVHTWFSPRWIVLAQSRVPRAGLERELQREVSAVDPLLPLGEVRALGEVRSRALATQRIRAVLVGALGGLALLLTFVGVYGVVASGVAERRHELGIRLALGATAREAISAAAAPGLTLAGAGIPLGLVLAWAAAPMLRHLVWGVGVFDPLTFGGAAVVLASAAALGSLIPALRAAAGDPAKALRAE